MQGNVRCSCSNASTTKQEEGLVWTEIGDARKAACVSNLAGFCRMPVAQTPGTRTVSFRGVSKCPAGAQQIHVSNELARTQG